MTNSTQQASGGASNNPYLDGGNERQAETQAELLELMAESEEEKQEDSVKKDLGFLNNLTSGITANITSKFKLLTAKGVKGFSGARVFLQGIIDKNFLKKLLKIFFVILFLLILIFVGIKLFSLLKENGSEDSVLQTTSPPAVYQPYQPSVYAKDAEVLKLEADLGILEKEMAGFNLKDSVMSLPSLDFEVSF
ncbi:hypothetical protein KKB40_01335 [Patescibacteria group bacterium]|nr:hypothetical protein [Patescibacteria group bacterium]